jgi:PII-like signaling protein
MEPMKGEQVLIRIFLGESDRTGGKPTYEVLVEMFRREKMRGATVLRGIMGYGAHSHPHTSGILRLSQDLPIVVEAVDIPENVERVLPKIEQMVNSGLITTEKVQVVWYGDERRA